MLTLEPFDEGINIGWFVMWNNRCIQVVMANDLEKLLRPENKPYIDELYDLIVKRRSWEEEE